jgi:hypothetical protein
MRLGGHGSGRLWLGVVALIAPSMLVAGTTVAASPSVDVLASCAGSADPSGSFRPRLRSVLDDRGWLTGHSLELSGDRSRSIRLARIAFLDGPFGDRWVFGDARHGVSQLRVLNAAQGCLEAAANVDGLVFSTSIDPAGETLVHDLVDPATRAELGAWQRPLDDLARSSRVLPGVTSADAIGPVWLNTFSWGPRGELEERSCGADRCVVRTLDRTGTPRTSRVGLEPGAPSVDGGDAPRVDPRPVPETGRAKWDQDTLLTYRWAGDPSAWVRRAVNAAAEDVGASRDSRAPRFQYDGSGDDTVGLEANMTGDCAGALACAHGAIPHWWSIRIRPQGTRLNWGVVRWCQAYDDPPNGCYSLEHVMVHEFGHIEGLAHPQDFGFRLGVQETVMGTAPPQRPATGWNLHRFGPCDVARLQRRYDVAAAAPLAVCDRVETRLTLDASPGSIAQYQPVTIIATLRVKDLDQYDRLGGNGLSGRAVTIERRPHGSGSWIAYEPDPGPSPGTYVLTFRPGVTSDFRATFGRPEDDGVTAATSTVVTVPVSTCSDPPCPTARRTGTLGQ